MGLRMLCSLVSIIEWKTYRISTESNEMNNYREFKKIIYKTRVF